MSMPCNLSAEEFSKQLAKHTYENLKRYEGENDVTMLIASFIGLLVIPRETMFKNRIPNDTIPKDLLKELQASVKQYFIDDKCPGDPSFTDIATYMRHAVCHGAIEFHGEKSNYKNGQDEITYVTFTSEYEDEDGHNRLFEIDVKVDDIRKILDCMYKRIDK